MSLAVITIIKGGLGNQLFIYATARALALRLNRPLYLDTVRGYTADGFGRSYRLDGLSIQAQQMPESWRVAPHLKHPRHKIIRALSKLLPRNRRSYLAERHNMDASQLTALSPEKARITLLGYWQDEGYFREYAEILRGELRPHSPQESSLQERGQRYREEDRVFIHFRRIDYKHLLGLDYYQRAIDEISKRLPDAQFVLFGDSIEEPSKGLDFRGHRVEVGADENGNELVDLWLMSQCRHAIIANSSFSWWGAWLSQFTESRLVYAPERMGWPLQVAADWVCLPNSLITE
ncbi:MAG: O-antigen biosynthesis glycosyltransferase WbnK [Gammaproteobacteria bacterium]|nr:MAG: O-antigen biosynthesis glycosyltransferase WbnK [Gammaproteobacteria bacterium]